MTIHNASELQEQRPQIDLNGPDGNAFALIALAEKFARQKNSFGRGRENAEAIVNEMMSAGDYEELLGIFEYYFGEYVDMYR